VQYFVGQRAVHDSECRQAIVKKILEDPDASVAARSQVDSCYTLEQQEELRGLRQEAKEQLTSPEQSGPTAVRLPFAKTSAEEDLGSLRAGVSESEPQSGRASYAGSSASRRQRMASAEIYPKDDDEWWSEFFGE